MSRYEDNRAVPPDLNDLYDQLNAELFGGTLPKVHCAYYPGLTPMGRVHYNGRREGRWGTRQWHNVAITHIDVRPGLTSRAVRKTMTHEMCHVYELRTFGRGGHDRNFWDIMARCGYPKDHRFIDQQLGEGDYYTGKADSKERKQVKAKAIREAGVGPGSRVSTPWGAATVKSVTPGKGRRLTRLVVDFDVAVPTRGTFVKYGVPLKANMCTPM